MILLKIIFFFVAIYYLFKLLARYLFPYLLKRQIQKLNKIYNSNMESDFYDSQQNTDDEITITQKQNNSHKKINNKQGEYVEYEEIK